MVKFTCQSNNPFFRQSHIKRAEDKCMVSVCFKVLLKVSREKCEDLDRHGETWKFSISKLPWKWNAIKVRSFVFTKCNASFVFVDFAYLIKHYVIQTFKVLILTEMGVKLEVIGFLELASFMQKALSSNFQIIWISTRTTNFSQNYWTIINLSCQKPKFYTQHLQRGYWGPSF